MSTVDTASAFYGYGFGWAVAGYYIPL